MKKGALLIVVIAFLAITATPALAQVGDFYNNFSGGTADSSGFLLYDVNNPASNGTPYVTVYATSHSLNGVTVSAPPGDAYLGITSSWGPAFTPPTGATLTAGSGWGDADFFGGGYIVDLSFYLDAGSSTYASHGNSAGGDYGTSFAYNQVLNGVGSFVFAPIFTSSKGATGETQVVNDPIAGSPACVTSATAYSFEIDPNGYSKVSASYPGINVPGGSTITPNGGTLMTAKGNIDITTAGWYTFQEQFYEGSGGYIDAIMSVINGAYSSGTVLGSWIVDTPTLLTAGMGGLESSSGINDDNNWWGATDGAPEGVVIDNASLMYTPEPISMIFFGTGLVAVSGYMARRRMARKA